MELSKKQKIWDYSKNPAILLVLLLIISVMFFGIISLIFGMISIISETKPPCIYDAIAVPMPAEMPKEY